MEDKKELLKEKIQKGCEIFIRELTLEAMENEEISIPIAEKIVVADTIYDVAEHYIDNMEDEVVDSLLAMDNLLDTLTDFILEEPLFEVEAVEAALYQCAEN